MQSIIRKYQQTFLIVLTMIIIASFVIWNGSSGGRSGIFSGVPADRVATIYGQNLSKTEIQQVKNKLDIAMGMGLTDLVEGLAAGAKTNQDAVNNFITNYYVMEHEAQALEIFPTDAEVQQEEMTGIPAFQTDGHFDPLKLTNFSQNALGSRGFNDSVIDDLARDQLRVKKLMALIDATVTLTPAEFKNRYAEANAKMQVSVIHLNLSDVEKAIPVSDADVATAYNQRPDAFQSEAQVKVAIASFELTPAQKELEGKDRIDALQALSDKSWDFAQKVVDKSADFTAQAKEAGATLGESALFSESKPDPALSKIPSLAAAAFRLSSDYPTSDVLEGQNGYYVLHLIQTVPSRQLSLAEAKPQIIDELKKERAQQLLQTKVNEIRDGIAAQMKAGKTFAQAGEAMGLPVETVPPFSMVDVSKSDVPDIRAVVQAALPLNVGQISDFVETDTGGIFVHLDSRVPPEMSAAEAGGATLKEQFAREQRLEAFFEWLRLRKDDAHLVIYQQATPS